MSNSKHTNKLINETSPYLLQHAENPVDWYPWGDEAFEKAKTEDKPVFLSIGYSTCHWCHVMAHESFESQEVADILNAGFVSIKVDREERPDIDEVYMNVCQAMTGSGGWPLTIFMSADKKPFFAGTYFPKTTKYGRMGMDELLTKIIGIWNTDRESLLQNSDKIIKFFGGEHKADDDAVDANELLENGFKMIKNAYEPEFGGFSHAPKFPTPHYLLFLLKYYKAHYNESALSMVEQTLDHMYRGGLFDHVGYGFSRYSTDHKWLVPHFEKMLYDNAMLLLAFTECFAVTGNAKYKDIAQKICTYVMRDMQSPEGGFYSAEDADSEGVEGKFYVFSYNELQSVLSEDELARLEAGFGISKQGNFEGKNILNQIDADEQADVDDAVVLKKLYDLRSKRVPPFKDTKISASWNGLMIEAMARAGSVFGHDELIDSAKKAADFVLEKMMDGSALLAIYKDGKRSQSGFLADYANMANALIGVYTVTLDLSYLNKAKEIAQNMIRLFWDEREDRFYMTCDEGDALFMRPKDEYDGAMPSGNACAIMGLVRLANLLGDDQLTDVLDRALHVFKQKANMSPSAHVHFLSALITSVMPHRQVILVSDGADEKTMGTYKTIDARFLPFTTLIYYDESEEMDKAFPALIQYKTAASFAGYVCENFTCMKPVYHPEQLLEELRLM